MPASAHAAATATVRGTAIERRTLMPATTRGLACEMTRAATPASTANQVAAGATVVVQEA